VSGRGVGTWQGTDGHDAPRVAETPHLVELIGDAVPGTPAPRGHLLLEGLGQRPEERCEWGTPSPLPSQVRPA